MKTVKTRVIAAVSAMLVTVSAVSFPLAVFAEEAQQTAASASSKKYANATEISSLDDFIKFSKDCTLDSNSRGKTYILTCDINLSSDFEPIPTFCGIFDGDGHTVSNLRLSENGSALGLFRYIEEGAQVKNLKVNGNITPGGTSTKCGGIVGVNRGRVFNCTFNGFVKGKDRCGGIAGFNEETGMISSCTSEGVVQAQHYTGGIVGENAGTVLYSTNNTSVNTNAYDESVDINNINIEAIYSTEQAADVTDAGGIAGYSGGAVQNCTNYGSIGYPHIGYNVGGIVGRQDGYVSGCKNYGTINGRKDTAGIVGQAEPYFSLVFSVRTLSKLRTQLDELNDMIDTTINHADSQSDLLSTSSNNVLDGLEEARTSADAFLDETDRIVNADIDSINELSSRASDLVDMAAPAADSFTAASDKMADAIEKLSDAAELLDDSLGSADTGMDILFPMLDDFSEALKKMKDASGSADSAMDALEKSVGDEEQMQQALDELQVAIQNMSSAISLISKGASNASSAYNKFKDTPEYTQAKQTIEDELKRLSEIADRLSDDLEKSESDIEAIQNLLDAGVTDFELYKPYLRDILDIFSDGSFSELFECLANITSAIYDLMTSQAAKDLEEQLKQSSELINSGLSSLDSASQQFNDAVGRINSQIDTTQLHNAVEYLRRTNSSLGDSTDDVQSMVTRIQDAWPYFDEASASALAAVTEAADAIDVTGDSLSDVKDGMDQITNILDYFAGMDKITFVGADDSLINARNSLSDTLSKLIDLCGDFTDTANTSVDVISEDMRRINDKAGEVSNTILDLVDEMTEKNTDLEDYTEDISSKDTIGRSDGKIAFSVNYGEVNGDVNVGGIAGSMAVEFDFDPEDDIETTGERSSDFIYRSKTVIRDSFNYGIVTSKKDGAGGIAGQMDTGCLISCGGYGEVKSTGGSYVGGVTGNSSAAIYGCYAKCRISGDDYIGGIAGAANDIEACRSYVEIEDGDENVGAIAGSVSGDMKNNIYVENGTGGVDGISYSGKAYPMSYENFMKIKDIPDAFGRFTVEYIVEDKVIRTLEFSYGESLSTDGVPEIPAKEGYYAVWDDFDYDDPTFSTKLYAEYIKYVTALSSQEKRENGLPTVIVEGEFTDTDKLIVVSDDSTNYSISEKWSITIPDDNSDTHTVRYLPTGSVKHTVVTVEENGVQRTAETTIDGQYLVFDVTGRNVKISAHSDSSMSVTIIAAAGGAAVLAVVIILIIAKKKKKRKAKAKEQSADVKQ